MTKLMIRVENKLNEVAVVLKEKLQDNSGTTTIEWIAIVILIIGLVILIQPLIESTTTKVAGLFDTIITDKINAIN